MDVYTEFKCGECGECDWHTKPCDICKKKYCSYKCSEKIVKFQRKIICKRCYGGHPHNPRLANGNIGI